MTGGNQSTDRRRPQSAQSATSQRTQQSAQSATSQRTQQRAQTQQVAQTQQRNHGVDPTHCVATEAQRQQSVQQRQQSVQQRQQSVQKRQHKKIICDWEIVSDENGQFVIGILLEDGEKKEWETNYLSKIVLHRQYLEGFTDSGSIYVMEYKTAKPGGHTLYTYTSDN